MEIEVLSAKAPIQLEGAAGRAAEVLAAGGIVVHPTETVYGIGGDGSPKNNELITSIKGRTETEPLILLIPDLATLHHFFPGVEWPRRAEELANRFWPGPLTLVVRCPGAPPGLLGPDGGVAVRVSPHETVKAILRHWHRPMTSSSANLSGEPAPRTLEDALALFSADGALELDRPLLALDAGPTPTDGASTIISFVESPPRVEREGPIGWEELCRVVPGLVR